MIVLSVSDYYGIIIMCWSVSNSEIIIIVIITVWDNNYPTQ